MIKTKVLGPMKRDSQITGQWSVKQSTVGAGLLNRTRAGLCFILLCVSLSDNLTSMMHRHSCTRSPDFCTEFTNYTLKKVHIPG